MKKTSKNTFHLIYFTLLIIMGEVIFMKQIEDFKDL